MSDTIDFDPVDEQLDAHLRRTLAAVAATITDTTRNASATSRPRRRRRAVSIASVAAIATAALVSVAWNKFDEGEIDRIPVEAAVLRGAAEGVDWWLIPSAAIEGHTNPCGVPMPGVEVISGDANKPGLEWNTGGVAYGEPSAITRYTCSADELEVDEAAWLDDPSRVSGLFTRLGDNDSSGSPWISAFAVHPSVTEIEIRSDGGEPITVPTVALRTRPTGPRYSAAALPADACNITVRFFANGNLITGAIVTRNLCE
jgi:hypothetical protein